MNEKHGLKDRTYEDIHGKVIAKVLRKMRSDYQKGKK